jgi:hypothetical protein
VRKKQSIFDFQTLHLGGGMNISNHLHILWIPCNMSFSHDRISIHGNTFSVPECQQQTTSLIASLTMRHWKTATLVVQQQKEGHGKMLHSWNFNRNIHFTLSFVIILDMPLWNFLLCKAAYNIICRYKCYWFKSRSYGLWRYVMLW